jgi:hypothetical protein
MMRLQAKTITLRADTWLQKNVPLIIESDLYRQGGALFITRDEGEDSGAFSDGPQTLKTLQEIFKVSPLWAVPRIPKRLIYATCTSNDVIAGSEKSVLSAFAAGF